MGKEKIDLLSCELSTSVKHTIAESGRNREKRKRISRITRTLSVPEKGKKVEYEIVLSDHARTRAQQRGLTPEIVTDALDYGSVIYRQGMAFYVVQKNLLPDWLEPEKRHKLNNLVIVLNGRQNMVITCYKCDNAVKHIRQKAKYLQKYYPRLVHYAA